MPRTTHPHGCQCPPCRLRAQLAQERDAEAARGAYFTDMAPYPRWGPTQAERARRRRDATPTDDVDGDLWLLRHAGVGQELGALDRIIARSNASR